MSNIVKPSDDVWVTTFVAHQVRADTVADYTEVSLAADCGVRSYGAVGPTTRSMTNDELEVSYMLWY
eukprot:9467906-Pyramimonas_sp.AAC.1